MCIRDSRDRHHPRPELAGLLDKTFYATARRDRDDVEAIRVAGDDVEGLLADTSGAPKEREPFVRAQDAPSPSLTWSLVRP